VPGDLFVSLPRLRAPAADGTVLAHPPLSDLADRVERNRTAFRQARVSIQGVALPELRRLAVDEVRVAAQGYFRDAGEPVPASASESLFVAGHQPELFHAGVWLKNFALGALAGQHGASPLNLVVDNDTAKSTSVRVPVASRDPATVHLVTVPFDHFAGEIAYEERAVNDEAHFADFPRRVAEVAAGWGFRPIVADLWSDVLAQAVRTRLLGERIASARRGWERRWGCHNLEVPLSLLSQTEAFARFACDLLDRLPDFHTAYNGAVRDYRRRHGIRSRNHPVPDLARDGDWLEAPFWAWRAGGVSPKSWRRNRLFVCSATGAWQLRAGEEPWPDLPKSRSVSHWQRLEAEGFKVRTRALTTTLFARLLLADLFIHGIGGGKYDELTDALLARHYGIEPPAYLVLTGTLHLPLTPFPTSADDLHAAARRVRDLYWNPQRHLAPTVAERPDVRAVLAEREALTAAEPTEPGARWERYRQLRAAGDRLRPLVQPAIEEAKRQAERAAAEVSANALLRRRDYACCLFPESVLKPFLTQFGGPKTPAPAGLRSGGGGGPGRD
jgi:hypothetical protein